MKTISSLEKSLSRIITEVSARLRNIGDSQPMQKECAHIEKTFGKGISGKIPEEAKIKAIQDFNMSKSITDHKHARLLCWGLMTKTDNTIIEGREFPVFLNEVTRFFKEKQLSTLAWRGLLHTYFDFQGIDSENTIGKANWEQLRNFLDQNFKLLYQSKKHKSSWMDVLNTNMNLLKHKPCEPYVEAILTGDWSKIDDLKNKLNIPEASWFFKELILSTIKRVCDFEDDDFKSHLESRLKILDNHKLYINDGLTLLLDRYEKCEENKIENKELSHFAQESWGNPKLERNVKWGRVKKETKAMVLKWLIGNDIRDFFNLLQEDGSADDRRMNFWLKYIGSIQDAYFALGSNAMNNRDEDFVNIRDRNQGRISRLRETGSRNNCFIMCMGKYILIEFGMQGNACYCFNHDKLPFKLNNQELLGNSSELKNKVYAVDPFPLSHVKEWENTFADELEQIGITQFFDENLFKSIIKQFNLKTSDRRIFGGALWVWTGFNDKDISSALTRLGFSHKDGKGWWYK